MAYTISYFVVILCIGLALFLVVHSSRRRDKAKPDAYNKPN
jgi:hypothetical protein